MYLGNIGNYASEQKIYELFKAFGEGICYNCAKSICLKPFHTGDRGYAMVNFFRLEDAQAAYDYLNGQPCEGITCRDLPLIISFKTELPAVEVGCLF